METIILVPKEFLVQAVSHFSRSCWTVRVGARDRGRRIALVVFMRWLVVHVVRRANKCRSVIDHCEANLEMILPDAVVVYVFPRRRYSTLPSIVLVLEVSFLQSSTSHHFCRTAQSNCDIPLK